ncbi:hypothetical protein ACFFUB_08205 [Algimonas porphyrae]|uniref:hypothetical protein n=1 Tax=Algimonas porphyrae TaxID=1128113 RepID=UPI0024E07D85|nr:hypothetical protein [Algimonas porphyrae]
MTRPPVIRSIAILFAALFLLGQGLASAHTVEFGGDHDHDGVACTVSVLGEDAALLPVPLETQTAPVEETPLIAVQPTGAVLFDSAHPCRAPPPRAPPQLTSHIL